MNDLRFIDRFSPISVSVFTPTALYSKAQGRRGTRRTLGTGLITSGNRPSQLSNPVGVAAANGYGLTQGARRCRDPGLWNLTPLAYWLLSHPPPLLVDEVNGRYVDVQLDVEHDVRLE